MDAILMEASRHANSGSGTTRTSMRKEKRADVTNPNVDSKHIAQKNKKTKNKIKIKEMK